MYIPETKMPEHKITKPNKTEVVERVAEVVPDLQNACEAIVTTQVIICEPMTDGTWRLITSFQDNYNIVLEERDPDKARNEVTNRLMEIKKKWHKKGLIIALENLLNKESQISKMANTTTSPAQPVESP
jgi:hypothetical protein